MPKVTDRIDPYTARVGYVFKLVNRSSEQVQQIVSKPKKESTMNPIFYRTAAIAATMISSLSCSRFEQHDKEQVSESQSDMSAEALICRMEMRKVTVCAYNPSLCRQAMQGQYRDCMELRKLQK